MRLVLFLLAVLLIGSDAARAQSGFVQSGGQAIPGATVTVTQGTQTRSTITDQDGHYGFPPLAPGTWTASVEMFGFETLKKDVDFTTAKGPINFELQLKPSPILARLQRMQQFARTSGGGPANWGAGAPRRNANANDQQEQQQLEAELNTQQQTAGTPQNESSNEAFLVSGSLSPGMAEGRQADSGPDFRMMGGANGMGPGGPEGTPNAPGFGESGGGGAPGGPGGSGPGGFGGGGFGGRGGGFGGRGGFSPRNGRRPGQTPGAMFGNRRRRTRQIHGMASFTLTNSALNAKPFSINGLDIPQAAYAQSRFSMIVGGPLLLGKLVKDPKTQFFLTYFGTRARTPELFTETVPTALERNGDFSQATQSLGASARSEPLSLFYPGTNQPIPGNRIPASMLNPIAVGLLRFYPQQNQPGNANNYQWETAQATNSDNLGFRVQRSITSVDRLSLNLQYQDRSGTRAEPFGYSDTTNGYGLKTTVQWIRNLSSTAISSAQVQFNRNYNQVVPYFSLLPDVAAELHIQGTSSNPIDYGPPALNFTNFSTLNDATPTLNRNQTQGGMESVSIVKGLHTISIGGGYTRADLSARTDPNARGTLNFTGLSTSALTNGQPVPGTGYDLADFLLGLPQSSSIEFSGFSTYFRQNQVNAYAQDEWKAKSNLTWILGVRYEYFSPFTEKYGRLANLDIAPDFANVAVVTPGGAGPYTGAFPSGLINPDYNNFSPRIGVAWKVSQFKKSTVVRAGYGIYYNGQAYIQFTNALAEQPPFAKSNSLNTSASNVLTLATAFNSPLPDQITNSFAVARNYRTPYAGTWNFSIQRDLDAGMFMEVLYMGTKGTGLDVRTAPNQPPPGSSQLLTQTNQLGDASGFTYDQSVGNSIFNALHVRVMRRFHHSLSFNALYQYAKSIDDSSTLGGGVTSVAQNWLDIEAERGLSSFDIRHQLTASFVWTSPIGSPTSRFASDRLTGRLLKDWQLSGSVTAQTGEPLTARVLGNTAQLAQTNGAGSARAEATGEPVESASGFFNLNAFAVPIPGAYGDAGRNTIPGPGLVNLNLAFGRSFTLSERRRLEFRVEANNALNHVNYTSFYTIVNSVNYGLPSAAASMRTLSAVMRFRF